MRTRDDKFRKDDSNKQGCIRKHVYNWNEQKECGQASHMGLPRESKGASKHSRDKESIEVTKAKTTRKEEDHRKEK